jgi:hypothetical protein
MVAMVEMRGLWNLEGFRVLFGDFYNKGRIVWGFWKLKQVNNIQT